MSTTSTSTASTTVTTPAHFSRACRVNALPISILPAITTRHRISRSTPTGRPSKTPCGRCSTKPIAALACAPPCSNATSTSRLSTNCWASWRKFVRRRHVLSPRRRDTPMVESLSLHDQQFRLSHHIRDPEHNPPPPGIEDRRLQIYRELFYNNLEDL